MINMCSHDQIEHGWWYRGLFPEAFARFKQKLVAPEPLDKLLAESGFVREGNIVPVDAVLQGDAYFDPRGPLSKEWRDGDSIFALATEEELRAGCSRIRKMDADGSLDGYLADHDLRRPQIGQVTFVHATCA
ncbi:MAG: hypothetical protein U0836_20960 [Pirellulales bacterium]